MQTFKTLIASCIHHSAKQFSRKKIGQFHYVLVGCVGLAFLGHHAFHNPLISKSLGLGEDGLGSFIGTPTELFHTQSADDDVVSEKGPDGRDLYTNGYYIKFRTNSAIMPKVLFDDFKLGDDATKFSQTLTQKISNATTQSLQSSNFSNTYDVIRTANTSLESIFENTEVKSLTRQFKLLDTSNNNQNGKEQLNNFYKLELKNPTHGSEDLVMEEFKNNPYVELVAKVPAYYTTAMPNDPKLSNLWYLSNTEADKAWNAGAKGSQSVIVAVVDNAIDISHEDLKANVVSPYDAADGDNDPSPPSSARDRAHGTHTAGSIAAVTDNSVGVPAISWNVKVMPIKATPSSAGNGGYLTATCEGVQYAVSKGAHAVSMSYGGYGGDPCMNSITAAYPNVMFIAAAGNSSTSQASYPCAANGVYCVGATTQSNGRASFSDYGSKVDIGAPGVNIGSTIQNNQYAEMAGTSMATPIVASLAGLLKSLAPNKSASEILSIISNTADALPGLQLGAGRINVCRAVNTVGVSCSPTGGGSGTTSTTSTSTSSTSTAGSTSSTSATTATSSTSTSATTSTSASTTSASTSTSATSAGFQRYACKGTSCVSDSQGPYAVSNCNNQCTTSTTSSSTTAGSTTSTAGTTTSTSSTAGSTSATTSSSSTTTAGSSTSTTASTSSSATAGSSSTNTAGSTTSATASTSSSSTSAGSQRYSCKAGDCIPDSSGIFAVSNCNNECVAPPSCSYICLTPSTATQSPNNVIFAGAQSCSSPGTTAKECSGTTKCSGICEDKSKRCYGDSDCPSNIRCVQRDSAQEGPCGGIPKYKCVAGGCVRDDTKGTYTHPSCNNMCAGGSGFSCQGAIANNAQACTDGPLPVNDSTAYIGRQNCSPTISCDRVCKSGYGLINGECVSNNNNCIGTIPSNANTCNDGPIAGAGSSYIGATQCSPQVSCDWTCNSGHSLSNGVCLPSGSTSSTTTTATSNGSSTSSGSTTGTPPNTGHQSYPAVNYSTTLSHTTAKPGDIITVKHEIVYSTYTPNFPLANLIFNETVLSGTELIANSHNYNGAGTLDRMYNDGSNKFTISITINGTPSSSDSNTKTWKGTLEYKLRVLATANNGSVAYQNSLGCSGLPSSLTYLGSQSCGTTTTSFISKTESKLLSIEGGVVACTPILEQLSCGNGKDDDCDGLSDCNDPDCKNMAICLPNPGTGSTTGSHNSPPTTGSIATGTVLVGCANGKLEGSEQCDDGNKNPGDGCSSDCQVEAGWKCTSDQPTKCGSIDCFGHGQYYRSDNLFGTCCSGLTGTRIDPNISATTGTTNPTYIICHDSSIDEPICLRESTKKEGRYLKKTATSNPELVFGATCSQAFKDYYILLDQRLKERADYCAYSDIDYSKVNFSDIAGNREKMSIQALQEFCIIKGRGASLSSFVPDARVSRAEFVKMLVKTMYIGKLDFSESGLSSAPVSSGAKAITGTLQPASTPYLDIFSNHWAAQYITRAHEDGILRSIDSNAMLSSLFYPSRSMKKSEIVAIMLDVQEGQSLTESSINELLGPSPYPTRAQIATLLVRKFMPTFSSYFYMQGNNIDYYRTLLAKLKGQKYTAQYQMLIDTIAQLDKNDSASHSSASTKDLNYYWMKRFLKGLVSG